MTGALFHTEIVIAFSQRLNYTTSSNKISGHSFNIDQMTATIIRPKSTSDEDIIIITCLCSLDPLKSLCYKESRGIQGHNLNLSSKRHRYACTRLNRLNGVVGEFVITSRIKKNARISHLKIVIFTAVKLAPYCKGC